VRNQTSSTDLKKKNGRLHTKVRAVTKSHAKNMGLSGRIFPERLQFPAIHSGPLDTISDPLIVHKQFNVIKRPKTLWVYYFHCLTRELRIVTEVTEITAVFAELIQGKVRDGLQDV
jgi:hypothetical protein